MHTLHPLMPSLLWTQRLHVPTCAIMYVHMSLHPSVTQFLEDGLRQQYEHLPTTLQACFQLHIASF